MKIAIQDLRNGAEAFPFKLDAVAAELDQQRFPDGVEGLFEAMPQESGWLLRAEIKTSWLRECDRCRCDVRGESRIEDRVLVLDAGGSDLGDTSDEQRVLLVEEGLRELDLLPQIREAVLLEQPDYVLCDEACAGLCPDCGCSLNDTSCSCGDRTADSPFAILRQLKTGTNKASEE